MKSLIERVAKVEVHILHHAGHQWVPWGGRVRQCVGCLYMQQSSYRDQVGYGSQWARSASSQTVVMWDTEGKASD